MVRSARACLAAIAVGVLSLGAGAHTATAAEPFGISTAPVADSHPLWPIWWKLKSDMAEERLLVAQCRAEAGPCESAAATQFAAIVKEGEPYRGLIRAGRVGRAANLALRRLNPLAANGAATAWTSPLQTLQREDGDCKQFAVLKYAALLEAGFAAEDVSLVIVHKKGQRDTHALVAVRQDERWYILDSRTLAVVDSAERSDYTPLYALDSRGVRRFVPPSAAPEIAAPEIAAPKGPGPIAARDGKPPG
jgi:predicted transglutaminase-like cysteine proteinase